MLFHVKHTHSAETCPAGNRENVRNTWGKVLSGAKGNGVKLVGAYVDAPAHTVFLVIDTDSMGNIEKLFIPVLKTGEAEITPVTNAFDTIKRFT